jgi:putative ABC transport system ATP-binding protein
VIRAEKITKRYQRREGPVLALADVSLEVAEGEFISIVGPSGCGKSTLLMTLGCLIRPTEGKVWLDGRSVYDLSHDEAAALRLKTIGFVFQTFNLVPYLTALENVQIPLYLSGVSPTQQQERAEHLLDKVGLGDRLSHKPSELSVGQQQRVALARTLANRPRLILADEPTGNLDPALAEEMLDHLEELHQEGVTVVMVTHDPRMAARAQRQLRLVEGRVSATEAVNTR